MSLEHVAMIPGKPFAGLVQAAGIMDVDEALGLAALGYHSLGFPLRLPVHAPDVSEDQAAAIIAALPAQVTPVLITYEPDPRELLALCRALRVRHLQFHADPDLEQSVNILSRLRQEAPDLFLIKSLLVNREKRERVVAKARALSPVADAFLLDTYDPSSGASGATGLTHDWSVSRELVRTLPRPVILAGGLGPDNVGQAVQRVAPAGVDAHTGLEGPDGRKDMAACRAFVDRAKAALARAASTP